MPMPDSLTIAIVDDHPFYRDGVMRALQKARGVRIVGTGGSADDAVRIVADQKPDILLLDIGLPGGGIEAARTIQASSPERTRIIILTGSDDSADVAAAFQGGVRGYLLKGADSAELLQAIRTVHQGETFITPMLWSRVMAQSNGTAAPQQASPSLELSARERQMLDLASTGLTNSEIATRLNLALPTVKNAMSRIFDKLGVRNRAEAIAMNVGNKRAARE
jgi:two-component system nitrate/nitrite response regulator NarL